MIGREIFPSLFPPVTKLEMAILRVSSLAFEAASRRGLAAENAAFRIILNWLRNTFALSKVELATSCRKSMRSQV